jgi:hypothetical protein
VICACALQKGDKGTVCGGSTEITRGMRLNLGGGISHTVHSGESLSRMAFVSFSLLCADACWPRRRRIFASLKRTVLEHARKITRVPLTPLDAMFQGGPVAYTPGRDDRRGDTGGAARRAYDGRLRRCAADGIERA